VKFITHVTDEIVLSSNGEGSKKLLGRLGKPVYIEKKVLDGGTFRRGKLSQLEA
jgi:hypothetical protein